MRDKAQNKAESWPAGNLRVHYKYRVHRHHQAKQQAVNEGLVIGHDQGSRVNKRAFVAAHFNTKKQFENAAHECFKHTGFPGAVSMCDFTSVAWNSLVITG